MRFFPTSNKNRPRAFHLLIQLLSRMRFQWAKFSAVVQAGKVRCTCLVDPDSSIHCLTPLSCLSRLQLDPVCAQVPPEPSLIGNKRNEF